MKKIIFILLTVTISTGAFAQLSFGLKGGVSSNNFAMENPLTITSTSQVLDAAQEASWGFHGGAFVRVSMLGFLIQPEVLFSTAENNIMVEDVSGLETLQSQQFNRIDVPLMLGIKLGPARLMAGPAASVMISSTSDLLTDAGDLYKQATFGYQAGIGLDLFGKLTLDARYEGGLNNFGDEIEVGGETLQLDGRASAFVFSLGIMF